MKKYFGKWSSLADIELDFGIKTGLTGKDILFAYYTYEDYSGRALVVFVAPDDGLLYLVKGSHCSCYGLDSTSYNEEKYTQWRPERINWEVLNKMKFWYDEDYENIDIEKDASAALQKLIARNLKS